MIESQHPLYFQTNTDNASQSEPTKIDNIYAYVAIPTLQL